MQAAAHRPLPRPEDPDDAAVVEAVDYVDAEDDLLADVDAYADWLCAACFGHGCVRLPMLPRDDAALQLVVDGLSVPQLVRMEREPLPLHRQLAALELTQRYLSAHAGVVATRAGVRAAERVS